jgi:DNA invertase Pin-like site-specific DNA recombinase
MKSHDALLRLRTSPHDLCALYEILRNNGALLRQTVARYFGDLSRDAGVDAQLQLLQHVAVAARHFADDLDAESWIAKTLDAEAKRMWTVQRSTRRQFSEQLRNNSRAR